MWPLPQFHAHRFSVVLTVSGVPVVIGAGFVYGPADCTSSSTLLKLLPLTKAYRHYG
jgi:hypothetical protein